MCAGDGSSGSAWVEGVGGARDARRLVHQLVVEAQGTGLAVVDAGVRGQRKVEARVAEALLDRRAPRRLRAVRSPDRSGLRDRSSTPRPPACVLVPWKCPFRARFPQLWVPQSCCGAGT